MTTEHVPLDLIDDNPYNPRQEYPATRVKEMALTLQRQGQLETPQARKVGDRYQLVSGHLRLRGLRYNLKKDPQDFTTMHLNVVALADDAMFFSAVEENLNRHELSPLELARAVDAFIEKLPSTTETELAKHLGFSLPHISNMRRVLRLPASMLEKINEEKLSFTQGRELLVLEALDNPEEAMKSACSNLKSGNKTWGEPNTVAGMQTAVYDVVKTHCRPLSKQFGGSRWNLLFDPEAAGCHKCEHTVKVTPQKGKSALFCTNPDCWDKHQEEHRQAASAEARQRVKDEVVSTAAEEFAAQEETTGIAATGIVQVAGTEDLSERIAAAPAPAPVPEAEQVFSQEKKEPSELAAKQLAEMEDDYPCKTCPKNADCDFSYVCVDGKKKYQCAERDKPAVPATPREEVILDAETFEKVHASYSADKIADKDSTMRRPFTYEGKKYISTAGASGGASRISTEECYQLVPVEEYKGEIRNNSSNEGRRNEPLGFYNGILVNKGTKVLVGPPVTFRLAAEAPAQEKAPAIPEEILAKAREEAGTRAEVLDIMEMSTGPKYNPQFKSGYANLDWERRYLDDLEECKERCTTGFHFAFDPRDDKPQTYAVCSNLECLKKKKAVRTRRLNSEGQAKKTREQRGVKAAVKATTVLDHGRMKLILHTQIEGYRTRYDFSSKTKSPGVWLWDKVSPGIKSDQRTFERLWKAVDKLSEEVLAKLIVEFCFYALTDHGDICDHEIKVEEQLRWLGVSLEEEKKDEKQSTKAPARRRGKAKAAAGEETTVATTEES